MGRNTLALFRNAFQRRGAAYQTQRGGGYDDAPGLSALLFNDHRRMENPGCHSHFNSKISVTERMGICRIFRIFFLRHFLVLLILLLLLLVSCVTFPKLTDKIINLI